MTSTDDTINIRTSIEPGDLGYMVYLHGKLYKEQCGYDHNFERFVALSICEFMGGFDPQKDCIWVAEDNNQIIGTIVIMGRSGEIAQLRYFLLKPEYRGIGLGNKLMELAMKFCKDNKYKSVYLHTTDELDAAAHLYRKHGFHKTREFPQHHWGKETMEQWYDLQFT